VGLTHRIVELIPKRADRAAAVSYRHQYDTVNALLDAIALRLSGELERSGHAAFPVPASRRCDDERICAVFSHKLAAHLAGLGWIGRSCLLVTPERGPRARWVSVLTDAPLAPTGSPLAPHCGDCRACVDQCPAHAFTGRLFDEREPREARYDARACEQYINAQETPTMPAVCGMCLWVCPHGRPRLRRRDARRLPGRTRPHLAASPHD
jgi:epoxyqueuosine reductase QueG